MATTTVTPATQTVDEEKFINKLYDSNLNTQKNTLQDHYTQMGTALDGEKQSVQQQTDTHLNRTDVEAQKALAGYYKKPEGPTLSGGANTQAALAQGNQRQQNVTTLKDAQSEADAEIERERALLASEYESAIRKAQADNDMERAQQLYDAAKLEEERLTEYKKTAGNLMAGKGDYSILAELYGLSEDQVKKLGGNLSALTPVTGTTTETGTEETGAAAGGTEAPTAEEYATPEALTDDEAYLRQIYEASVAGQNEELKTKYDRSLSELEAERQAAQKQTDADLNAAYVDAMRKAKNYNEVQRAYGMGSGTLAQAQLAQDLELQKDMTALRGLYMGTDAGIGRQESDLLRDYLSGSADAETEAGRQYAEALIKAAQEEEARQIALQLEAGNLMATKNDYSILGALYGLTPDQIDRLQGTGAYTPVYVAPSSGTSNSTKKVYKELIAPREVDDEKAMLIAKKKKQ